MTPSTSTVLTNENSQYIGFLEKFLEGEEYDERQNETMETKGKGGEGRGKSRDGKRKIETKAYMQRKKKCKLVVFQAWVACVQTEIICRRLQLGLPV